MKIFANHGKKLATVSQVMEGIFLVILGFNIVIVVFPAGT